MPTRERVAAFIAMVEADRFVEAIEGFYAEDASMQDNDAPPRLGRAALVAAEEATLAAISIHTRPVETYLVDGDKVVIRWVFEVTFADGRQGVMDELALQDWQGERIVRERFFYDPGWAKSAVKPGG
jgi:ketosteroid isomerase-like protein